MSTNAAYCSGGAGSITVNVTGGVPPFDYYLSNADWDTVPITKVLKYIIAEKESHPANSYTFTPFHATEGVTHYVYVVKNMIIYKAKVTLTADSIVVDKGLTCNYSSDAILAIAHSGGTKPYTYEWLDEADWPPVTVGTDSIMEDLPKGAYTVFVTDASGCESNNSILFGVYGDHDSVPDPVVLTVENIKPSCDGESDGEIEVSGTGGTGALTFTRVNVANRADSSSTLTGLPQETTYDVYATDTRGCFDKEVNQTVGTLPKTVITVSLDADPAIGCIGSDITFTATSNNPGTSPFYEFFVNGTSVQSGASNTYTTNTLVSSDSVSVEHISSVYCNTGLTTDYLIISVLPPPSANISTTDNPSCEGEDVTFTATTDIGEEFEFFVNGSSEQAQSSLSTFTTSSLENDDEVYVVVTDNNTGCYSTSSSITMVINDTPTADLNTASTESCAGDPVTFNATTDIGDLFEFFVNGTSAQAQGASNTFITSTLATGNTVTVEVTNSATGCSQISSGITMTINPLPAPSLSANPGTTICAETNVTFTAGNCDEYAFLLNSAIVQARSSQNTYSTTELEDWDEVSVIGYNNLTGCYDTSAVITMRVNPIPNAQITVTKDSICVGELVTFTGSGGNLYEFYINNELIRSLGVNPNFTPNPALNNGDEVWVKVVYNGTLCFDFSDTITMYVSEPPDVTLTSSDADNEICQGDEVTFTAVPEVGNQYEFFVNGSNAQGPGLLNTYTTTALNDADAVTVTVTNSLGCSATSTSITTTVNPLPVPTLSANPGNTICDGTSVEFTADGGAQYEFFINSLSVQGQSTDNTYSSNTLINNDAITVEVTSAEGCVATSAPITMFVNPIPTATLVSDASGDSICQGDNVTFTAGTDVGTQFEFFVNSISVQAQSPLNTYSTANINNGDEVTVVLTSGPGCSKESDPINMTVLAVAAITVQPVDTIFCETESAVLSVTATGYERSYQWYKNNSGLWTALTNGGRIAGATSKDLQISNLNLTDQDEYFCRITGYCNAINSDTITLTVGTEPDISDFSPAQEICEGEDQMLYVTATGTNLSYQWQKYNGTTWQNISDNATYSGTANDTLYINNITTGYEGDYRCFVSGYCGILPGSSITVTINYPVIISSPSAPVNRDKCEDDSVHMQVTASGTINGYQWQRWTGAIWTNISNGANISGATSALVQISNLAPGTYQYRCRVFGECDTVNSNDFTVNVGTTTAVTVQPASDDLCLNANTLIYLTADGTNLTYQWQKQISSVWSNLLDTGNYSGTTNDSLIINNIPGGYEGSYRCIVSGDCGIVESDVAIITIYYPVIISSPSAPVNRDKCEDDSVHMQVTASGSIIGYQWQRWTGAIWTNISNGANISGATSALVQMSNLAPGNYQYRCRVYGVCDTANSSNFNLAVGTETAITVEPTSREVCEGLLFNVSFNTKSDGDNLTFSWYKKNGENWQLLSSGITSLADESTLTISQPIELSDSGTFRCIVTGDCGSDTSNTVTLIVNPLTEITWPLSDQNITICEERDTFIYVTANGTDITYQWRKWNTGTSTWDDLPGETNDTLIFTNLVPSDDGQYRCYVDGACGGGMPSNRFTMNISLIPVIITEPVSQTICETNTVSFFIRDNDGATYQWQSSTDGLSWSDLSNSGQFTGTDTDSLVIDPVGLNDSILYRCIVFNGCGSDTSAQAKLDVNKATEIITQPIDTIACLGSDVYFKVEAVGVNLTYTWYYWDVNTSAYAVVPNNSKFDLYSDSLVVNNIEETDTLKIFCLVNSLTCTNPVYSDTVRLTPNVINIAVGKPSPYDIASTTQIEVSLSIYNHSHMRDLSYYLISPEGNTVILHEIQGLGCVGTGMTVDLVFSTESVNPYDPCSYSGTYAATGDWSLLNGEDPANGKWRIKIVDRRTAGLGAYDGSITSASIRFIDNNSELVPETVTYDLDNSVSIRNNGTTYLNFSLDISVVCSGDCDALGIISHAGGVGNLTYEWLKWNSITSLYEAYTPEYPGTDSVHLCAGDFKIIATDELFCQDSNYITVLSPPPIIYDTIYYTDSLNCNGDTDGEIRVSGSSGGVGSLEYSIDGTTYQSDTAFTGLGEGKYYLYIRDGNGCVITDSVTINGPDSINILSIEKTDYTCYNTHNGIINIQANGGRGTLSYIIGGVDADTNQTGIFPNLAYGKYGIKVTDNQGCYNSIPADSVTIINPDTITIISVTIVDENCPADNNGMLIINATGGTDSLFYSIDDLTCQYNDSIINLDTGNYTVYVRDVNNCKIDSGLFRVNGPETIVLDSIVYLDSILCFGDNSGYINIYASGGKDTLFYSINGIWDTTHLLSGLTAGTYNIDITDKNGCPFADTTIYIIQPDSFYIGSILATNITCNNSDDGTITVNSEGGVLPKSFQAITGTDTTFKVAANDTTTITGLKAGVYSIRIVDANGCETIYSGSATIVNPPVINITSIIITDETCPTYDDGELEIIATGGTDTLYYSIDDVLYQKDSSFDGLDSGSYIIYIKDVNNCKIDSTVHIDGHDPIALDSIVYSPSLSCFGNNNGYIRVYASGGKDTLFYARNGGSFDTTSIFTGLTAGSHIISITDKNSCPFNDTTIIITEPDILEIPTVDITSQITCNDLTDGEITINTTGGTLPKTFRAIKGTDTSFVISNKDTAIISNLDSGKYTIKVLDANGCEAMYFSYITIINPDTIDISAVNVTDEKCPGYSDGQIVVTASGGTGALMYSLDNNTWQSNSTFTGLTKANYNVYVRDIKLCLVQSLNHPVNSPLPIITTNRTVDSTSYICYGDSNLYIEINATGEGPLQFKLNNGPWGTDSVFDDGLGPGTYTIYIQDINGCDRIDTTFTWLEPDSLYINSVSYSNNSQYNIDDGIINFKANGGRMPYSYSVDSGKTWAVNNGNFTGLPGDSFYYLAIQDSKGCIARWPDSIYLSALYIDTVYYSDSVTCNNYTDGWINIRAKGGSGNYEYLWNGDSTSNSDSAGLASGTYIVGVHDIDFDTTVWWNTIFITNPAPLTYDVEVYDFTCHDHAAKGIIIVNNVAGSNGGYLYDWDGPDGYDSQSPSILNLDSGIYKLTITDKLGCSVTFTDTIVNPEPIILSDVYHYDDTCYAAGMAEIHFNASGGTGALTYAIGNGYSDQLHDGNFLNLVAGTYTLIATDANECKSEDTTIIVRQPDNPITINPNYPNMLDCSYNTDGFIEIVGSSGGGGLLNIEDYYRYLWSNGSAQTNLYNLSAGDYSVTVTDVVSCTEVFYFTINSPDKLQIDSVRIFEPICNIEPFNGVDTGTVYIHSMKGGTPFNDGSYRYRWSTGDSVIFISNLSKGQYSVTVTDKNDCEFDTTFILSPDPDNVITVDAGDDVYICEGETIRLLGDTSGVVNAIRWTGSDGTVKPNLQPEFSPVVTTTYYMKAYNNFCQDNDTSIVFVYPRLGLNIEEDSIQSSTGLSIELEVNNEFESYLWIPGLYLDDSTDNDPVLRPTEPGTYIYIIQATTANGCIETDTILIDVIDKYGAPNGFTPNGDGINDEWILPNEDDLDEVIVVNRWGEVVFNSKNYSIHFRGKSNKGKDLPTGTYYYIITFKEELRQPERGSITIIR